MKINEVTQPSNNTLFEAIDNSNNTGFLTEDLMKIYRTEKENKWSEPTSMEELLEEMDSWDVK